MSDGATNKEAEKTASGDGGWGFGDDPPSRKPRLSTRLSTFNIEGNETKAGALPEDADVKKPQEGGWGFGDAAKNSPSLTRLDEDEEQRRASASDDDIPVIPDLEEVREEELTVQVAQPPQAKFSRVATIRELDSDLLTTAAYNLSESEIDLSILSKVLLPSDQVIEEDKAWDWDRTFTEVSSEMQAEWDRRDVELQAEVASEE
eukprot:Nk52_evm12s1967 gene=Nk52_evmTU12s1967